MIKIARFPFGKILNMDRVDSIELEGSTITIFQGITKRSLVFTGGEDHGVSDALRVFEGFYSFWIDPNSTFFRFDLKD